jgi:hypothetical protein
MFCTGYQQGDVIAYEVGFVGVGDVALGIRGYVFQL